MKITVTDRKTRKIKLQRDDLLEAVTIYGSGGLPRLDCYSRKGATYSVSLSDEICIEE